MRAAKLIGLLHDDPASWDAKAADTTRHRAVEKLIAERLAARSAKNFGESDRLRDLLVDMGVKLKDGKDKTTGEPTRPNGRSRDERSPSDEKENGLAQLAAVPGPLAEVHRRRNHRAGAGRPSRCAGKD